MAITINQYDTATLLGVMREMAPVPNYWLSLAFGSEITFEDEYIDFEKVSEQRKLAPLVAPMSQGKPLYTEASEVTRLKPAYVKAKDPVSPHRMIRKRPGELAGETTTSPDARLNAVIGDISRTHLEAIQRRWEWLAAQAIIYGKVTLAGEGYPERVVDFKRAANHTVALGAGTYWTNSSDIIADINLWRKRVRDAQFGGPTNRLTVGSDVWDVMSKNSVLKGQLDTQVRGTDANFKTGIRSGENVEFMGTIGGNLDVYVYSDYYQTDGGTAVPFMSSKDVVLTGPNINGVRAFGAILDLDANLRALSVFPKTWKEQDPSVMFYMTQSAPLMIPVNPNNSLRATVLA